MQRSSSDLWSSAERGQRTSPELIAWDQRGDKEKWYCGSHLLQNSQS